eukprot:GEZU01006970.1.p1 GENE.GEZU01006970.1~~GEZU01006970.1.p1  ORF type:complete len:274 (-),score=81.15 GEZU01006970.1:247-1068(-)
MSSGSAATTLNLEQSILAFVSLAKNAKGKGAADVIREALNHPQTFVFAELLETPNIKELDASTDAHCKQMYELLKIFAFGTYSDYLARKAELPELNEKQTYKLRKLSVVSLSAHLRVLPYAVLLEQLAMDNLRELEDLLIDCMYQGIIRGKLDQRYKCIEIFEAIGRDLRPGQLQQMQTVLQNWLQESDKILAALEQTSQTALAAFEASKKHQEEFDEKVENIKKNIKTSMELSELDRASGMGQAMGGPMGMSGPPDFDMDYGYDEYKRGYGF